MALACGDKDLMTAASGRTVDDPCMGLLGRELYCNIPDVQAWKRRVAEFQNMMVIMWNALWDAEAELPKRVHTAQGSNLRLRWNRIENRTAAVEDVPFWGIGDRAEQAANEYAAIVQDQACVIEIMRDFVKGYGKRVPRLPYFRPRKREKDEVSKVVNALLIIGGISAIAYVFRPVLAQALRGKRLPKMKMPTVPRVGRPKSPPAKTPRPQSARSK